MKRAIVLATLAACAPVAQERALRAGTVFTSGLILCDMGQTYWASNSGEWNRPGDQPDSLMLEKNPLLGPTPSPHVLALTAIIGTTANVAIGLSHLPRWARASYLLAVGALESYIVAAHVDTAGVCGGNGVIE